MISVDLTKSRRIDWASISVMSDMLRAMMTPRISTAPGYIQSFNPFQALTDTIIEKCND